MVEHVRLSKLMSEQAIASRREADRLIADGQVLVNGVVVDQLGEKVPVNATITLKSKPKKMTLILHKPLGYISLGKEKNYPEAKELITDENQVKRHDDPPLKPEHLEKLGIVGRLDIDSKGLLLFTQDGTLAKKIIGENTDVEKEYLVRVRGEVTPPILRNLRHGLFLDGAPLKRARVDEIEPNLLKIILKEGKKRQIRRMCESVGLEIVSLKRVRIGTYVLGDLPLGKWRFVN